MGLWWVSGGDRGRLMVEIGVELVVRHGGNRIGGEVEKHQAINGERDESGFCSDGFCSDVGGFFFSLIWVDMDDGG